MDPRGHEKMNELSTGKFNKGLDGWMDGWMEGWMDGWMDG